MVIVLSACLWFGYGRFCHVHIMETIYDKTH